MPTITMREGKRTTSYLVQVRVADFEPINKTFKAASKSKHDRAAAEKEADKWGKAQEKELRGLATRGTRRDVARLTVSNVIAEYLKDPEVAALRTFSDTERLTTWWSDNYGNVRVLDANQLTWREARDKLQEKQGRAAGTINRYLSAMRATWNWGISASLVPADRPWPASRLMLSEPRGRTRFLSDVEITALLKAAESDKRIRAAIIVAVSTGLRQGEMLRLKWADVDLTGAKVTVRESKNGEQRQVHLPVTAVDALKERRDAPIASLIHPFVTESGSALKKAWLETRWRVVRDAAGLKDFHWHDLRHSCASYLAQSGATLLEIGGQLGHKSPSVTLRYAHLMQATATPAHAKLDAKLRG
jgi:integrase